jgi:hypothetical protein
MAVTLVVKLHSESGQQGHEQVAFAVEAVCVI